METPGCAPMDGEVTGKWPISYHRKILDGAKEIQEDREKLQSEPAKSNQSRDETNLQQDTVPAHTRPQ